MKLRQIHILGRDKVAELLISHGSNVSATNKDGNTPLHEAAQNRNKTTNQKYFQNQMKLK